MRPSDPDANQFQEVQIAVDASRDGLRFISRLGHWYVGMGLLVNFPYSRTESLKWDYLGRVVRLEQLDDGCLSVALRYMSRFNLPSYSTPAWRQFR